MRRKEKEKKKKRRKKRKKKKKREKDEVKKREKKGEKKKRRVSGVRYNFGNTGHAYPREAGQGSIWHVALSHIRLIAASSVFICLQICVYLLKKSTCYVCNKAKAN